MWIFNLYSPSPGKGGKGTSQQKAPWSTYKKIMEALIQKYKTQLLLIGTVFVLAILSSLIQSFLNEKPQPFSLDKMIPEGFVLIPIEIENSEDIINLIGSYGVIDLYSYSSHLNLPQELAAQSLKVIPTKTEENRFAVIAPEKEVLQLLAYRGPFYAVVQNPKKTGSQIHKKRIKKHLTIIEESF